MKIKCDYCGNFMDENDEKCPYCGAVNNAYNRSSKQAPRTIEELKSWYVAHNLPPEEVTRFFIGKDIREPRAFGIYRDPRTGEFVVYKNKDDGSRAVRYQGADEAYAVNELYMRLKEEISLQKGNNARTPGQPKYTPEQVKKRSTIVVVGFVLFVLMPWLAIPLFLAMGLVALVKKLVPGLSKKIPKGAFIAATAVITLAILTGTALLVAGYLNRYERLHSTGYYSVEDDLYYRDGEDWYLYDGEDYADCLAPIAISLYEQYELEDYEVGSSELFENSVYYETQYVPSHTHYSSGDSDSSYSSDDWDSGSSWDSSDSWDSGTTDWGSDW